MRITEEGKLLNIINDPGVDRIKSILKYAKQKAEHLPSKG